MSPAASTRRGAAGPPPSGRRTATVYRRRRLVTGAAAVLVVLALVLVFVLVGDSKKAPAKAAAGRTHHHRPSRCPLTDTIPAGGQVPERPAVAVKVGNEPQGARPQSGLNEADIVYDTPAEGYIMRYVAVYQCQTAASIGPTRSVRWVDWHLLQAFGQPILAFAGGINPDVDTVDSLGWLKPADLLTGAASAGVRITSRVPPDNLYTSTGKLWALYPHDTAQPKPVFSYGGPLPSSATPAASLAIDFSPGTDVLWKWDPTTGLWDHTYAGVPDTDALTGKPVTTTNIVVQVVHFSYGPYAESPGSTGDVESVTTGAGKGWVLRDGKSIAVTWSRPTTSSPTSFADSSGQKVTLAPGRTWVEIVLDTTAGTKGDLTISRSAADGA